MGSDSDGILHKRAQPRQPAERLVLQLERPRVVPELELARQPLERQLPRRASPNVISSITQAPSLLKGFVFGRGYSFANHPTFFQYHLMALPAKRIFYYQALLFPKLFEEKI